MKKSPNTDEVSLRSAKESARGAKMVQPRENDTKLIPCGSWNGFDNGQPWQEYSENAAENHLETVYIESNGKSRFIGLQLSPTIIAGMPISKPLPDVEGSGGRIKSSPYDTLCRLNPTLKTDQCWEIGGVMGLVGLVVFYLTISWRAWPDPLIDFGRELYVPWRLSQGAVLYRDVDNLFGPLSQYFNCVLFTCFGSSLMVLVMANIILFMGILGTIYFLFRRAWGVVSALAAAALFISVFGFSQLNWCGNFNYVTPYSHETTHGLLVCLLLIVVLVRWVINSTLVGSFLAGLLFGFAAILKPEIMLAGGLLIAVAILEKLRSGTAPCTRSLAAMGCGAILPTMGFTAYFAAFMTWKEALGAACHGWLTATASTRFSALPWQMGALGLDHPWENLRIQALATLLACLLVALMALVAWLLERAHRGWLFFGGIGLMAGGLAWLATYEIAWVDSGRCLPGLMLIYLLVVAFGPSAEVNRQAHVTRLLMAVLAISLLARMILAARVYQYGYYQAALAAIMVPAVLMGELPDRIGVGRKGAVAIAIGTLALVVPGVVILSTGSQIYLNMKTILVGTDGDQFYAYPPQLEPTGKIVNSVSRELGKLPRNQTLLVLPEGVMINYLARLPSPIAPFCYYGPFTASGREDRIVEDLRLHPPDCVVIISRDLREYGVERYGSQPDEGQQILRWINENYKPYASLGGDPLDYRQRGAILMRRKNESP